MSSCQPRDLMNVEEFTTEADFTLIILPLILQNNSPLWCESLA